MNRLCTPRWLTVAAVCAAITLAGCGSQVAGRAAGRAQTASTTSHAASPRQRAAADAARIIADFPPGVRAVTVTPVFGLNPDPRRDRLDRPFTVTDPAKVARIVALADALPVFPPGVRPCPADFGSAMRVTFLARPGGPVLARLSAQYGGCGSVSVGIAGRNQPALSAWTTSGSLFQDRVLAIAGVRWPVTPGLPGLAATAA